MLLRRDNNSKRQFTPTTAARIPARVVLALALACIAPQQAIAAKKVKKGAYGAIALERQSGRFGYSYNHPTARLAKLEALKQCGSDSCEIMVSFKDGCAALARGPKKYFTAIGAVRQEAETKVMRLCASKDCQAAAWACTK